jgi:hypothetical protein
LSEDPEPLNTFQKIHDVQELLLNSERRALLAVFSWEVFFMTLLPLANSCFFSGDCLGDWLLS